MERDNSVKPLLVMVFMEQCHTCLFLTCQRLVTNTTESVSEMKNKIQQVSGCSLFSNEYSVQYFCTEFLHWSSKLSMIYVFQVTHQMYILPARYRLVGYIILSVTTSEIFLPDNEGSHGFVAYNNGRADSHWVQKYSIYVDYNLKLLHTVIECVCMLSRNAENTIFTVHSHFFYRLPICGANTILLEECSKKAEKALKHLQVQPLNQSLVY